MDYRRCGASGVMLPALSIGLWQNFGQNASFAACLKILKRSLDLGICHIDLANNYGPPPGAAESCFGRMLRSDFAAHRDEMFISTKAGHSMWDGVYGAGGSRKHLLASLDQSLSRMGLDYVDVFYSHCPDLDTPLEETVNALISAVRSGKALYIGLSKYQPDRFKEAVAMLKEEKIPCLIHQYRYNLLARQAEEGIIQAHEEANVGSIVFSPLAQGQLTGKYASGVHPAVSRVNCEDYISLSPSEIDRHQYKIVALNQLASDAGLSLTHLSLAWLLQKRELTSVLIGVRNEAQLNDCAAAMDVPPLEASLLSAIDAICMKYK